MGRTEEVEPVVSETPEDVAPHDSPVEVGHPLNERSVRLIIPFAITITLMTTRSLGQPNTNQTTLTIHGFADSTVGQTSDATAKAIGLVSKKT